MFTYLYYTLLSYEININWLDFTIVVVSERIIALVLVRGGWFSKPRYPKQTILVSFSWRGGICILALSRIFGCVVEDTRVDIF